MQSVNKLADVHPCCVHVGERIVALPMLCQCFAKTLADVHPCCLHAPRCAQRVRRLETSTGTQNDCQMRRSRTYRTCRCLPRTKCFSMTLHAGDTWRSSRHIWCETTMTPCRSFGPSGLLFISRSIPSFACVCTWDAGVHVLGTQQRACVRASSTHTHTHTHRFLDRATKELEIRVHFFSFCF